MTSRQQNINRLADAITWMREKNIIATRANVKSVANRFTVHWKSLSEALQIQSRGGELAHLPRGKKLSASSNH